ncbi:S1 RNA-binding domain-containing protein [uncultured Ruegeria sp.]|uniref:S1 RNA-binding domain-containing protein n=1 Tax=uncultured Ruegeria sp. TaxID=259304 RepID=UPI0026040C5F|nr:S1 RNA-binding domain-containing protein [uncultured Ruegeria sp.]
MFTESDVEQKFVYGLLTKSSPDGLDFFPDDIQTKRDIRKIVIGKGRSQKLYYPDYAIVIDGVPSLIVEAKEPNDDNLEEAFREARLYAHEINALYDNRVNPCERIIATNGLRLIAGFSDQQSPAIDLNVENCSVTNQDFIDLLRFGGRDVVASRVSAIRSEIRGVAKYTKPVFSLGGKSVINESVGANDFGSNVSLEYQSLFNPETIEEKAGIVENAYIRSKRRESHVAPIDRVLRATIPPHQRDSNTINDTENPTEIFETLGTFENRDRLKNELCLLVGGVGAGKSTFTEFLRLKALPQSLVQSTRWVNVDLNNAPLSKTEIYDWILDAISKKIRYIFPEIDFESLDFLKKLYSKELGAVAKGRAAFFPPDSIQHLEILAEEMKRLQGDTRQTLVNLISLLFEERGLLLVIVLDNCDKRTRDDQLLMFEVAAWLKNEFRCLIFLPLRDTTYDTYSDLPPLDTVIKDLVFRIEAPLLEKVLSARMGYLLRSVGSNPEKFRFSTENGVIVSCGRNEVANFMRCIITTLFQDKHFKSIIKGLAGRNIRRGLEVVLDFCKSGHISADDILKMRLSNGEYRLPSHLVYRVLLKGNRRYFSDEKSRLVNVFHSDPRDELPDPFVRLDILCWLKENFKVSGPNNTKGFHKVETLVQVMQGLGHARERTIAEVASLVQSELVMTEGLTKTVDIDDLVVLTASGFTHLNVIRNINYLSIVSEDTFFRDSMVANRIADNLVGRGLFKAGSKDAALSSSVSLVNYLSGYGSQFFLENQIAPDSFSWSHTEMVASLTRFVESKEVKSDGYSAKSRIAEDFPRGSEHLGQVASIQNYGIFVELDSGMDCFVHQSDFGKSSHVVFSELEEGDQVIVKIKEYNTANERLKGSLVEF